MGLAWEAEKVRGMEEVDLLVYRSNLLGQDRSVSNWGGGNTSFKTVERDFRGREMAVLYVKGSGSDLANIGRNQFTRLRLEDTLLLLERDEMSDEEMVAYLVNCMIDAREPRSSIETLLHAFLPFPCVDHTHPDAILSICCSDNGKQIAEEIYGDRFVWVPYVRPGFTLSKLIAQGVQQNPHAELVLMEKHGLVTWGDTNESCYAKTLAIIDEAAQYIASKQRGRRVFGGAAVAAMPVDARRELAAKLAPRVRRAVSASRPMVVSLDDSEDVLQFVNSRDAATLSQVGAACPDHLVHTKRVPLFVNWNPAMEDETSLYELVEEGIRDYVSEYSQYFKQNRSADDQMTDAAPRVILIPGIGMLTTGKNKAMADVSASLYHRAIAVMEGATALGQFVSLNSKESYGIEYWPLELYKLTLAPAESEFSRKVALITGGAGGIGSSTAHRLAKEGAHVVLADLNIERAQVVAKELCAAYGAGRACAVEMDVTKEADVKNAFAEACTIYGGIDIVVNNAGLATSSAFELTTLDEWNLNMNVLATGYFLVAREGFTLMKEQGLGGNMVFIGSKNSIYAGKNAAAYSTAKAAEVHLARCIAAEGGEFGIRVNSVLPDAVLQGSAIWSSSWREGRAKAYGIEPEQLEEYYRKRTILLENVFPNDIAEAVAFLASSKAAKTTGCMVTVDGGVAASFTR